MKHIFVESNWVFGCFAPAHHRNPSAESLLTRARSGELTLHLPAICIRAGADAIRKKCQPREAKGLREFRRWARDRGELTEEESQAAFHFLEKFERSVSTELRALDSRLEQLRGCVGVQIFALSEGMLERAIALRTQAPDLKPFDEAILAAVLERADELRQAGATSLSFCTLDSDLRTASLAPLYQRAGLAVHNGFEF